MIYYYANGKRYSFNGPEDVGDLPFGEVERCTNFGVKQDTVFQSIGHGDLTAPLYDFGFAQQATVLGKNSAYRSRSLIQSGSDYIVVFDDVAQDTLQGRFSWFTGTKDEFPFIHQVQPGASVCGCKYSSDERQVLRWQRRFPHRCNSPARCKSGKNKLWCAG